MGGRQEDRVDHDLVAGRGLVLAGFLIVVAHRPARPLPDLRCVSATGGVEEGVGATLVRVSARIKLVNAYGLTETSDDINHEVMDGVPDSDQVPLGRPINNVHIQVLDEHLAPVPLAAPGERSSAPGSASAADTSTTPIHRARRAGCTTHVVSAYCHDCLSAHCNFADVPAGQAVLTSTRMLASP
jgi:non-ribosomal peptide synthetase component F